jgi:aryl-alcohol dehydrogenase-like predicted oxidoreductase
METRTLGNTEMQITRIGLGTWSIGGGDDEYGWGPRDDSAAVATLLRALELGINWIDTAAIYGLGHAEMLVARALREWCGQRPYIFTKCGLVWDAQGRSSHNLKRDSILRECDASLERLRVEAIDLYQIHWPAFPPGGPDRDIEEAWQTLAELKQVGKVRHIGVSNFSVAQMERVRTIAPISSLQPPYSVLRRDIERDILPYCQRHGIGVIVYSPLESGLLSGKMTRERIAALPKNDWRRWNPDFQEPQLSRNLALVEILRQIAARHGCSVAEVAVAWTLRHPTVTGAIVGARRPEQIEESVPAAALRLTDADLAEIDAWHRRGASA